MYLEGLRADGDSSAAFETGQRVVVRYLQAEDVEQRREEEEQLGFGQDVAETHAATHSEGNEEFRFVDGSVGADEALRIERLRVFPQRRVHVHGVDQRDHLRPFRDRVTVQCRRSESITQTHNIPVSILYYYFINSFSCKQKNKKIKVEFFFYFLIGRFR